MTADRQKVILLTGGSDGLGRLAAKRYLEAGWRVVITGRDRDKTAQAVAEARRETGRKVKNDDDDNGDNTDISYILMDLCSLASVRAAADEFLGLGLPLDVLLNNAGGVLDQRAVDPSGTFEMSVYGNFVGTFYLTELLADKLVATGPGTRVLIVTSAIHDPKVGSSSFSSSSAATALDLDNLDGHRDWTPLGFYRLSKLCNIYHTYLLAPRLEPAGVTVNCFSPGFVPATSLVRSYSTLTRLFMRYVMSLMPFATSVDRSADQYLYYGTSDDLHGVTGAYFRNGLRDQSSDESHDMVKARAVWNLSCDVTGLKDRKLE